MSPREAEKVKAQLARLRRHQKRDEEIAARIAAGCTLEEVGAVFHLSRERVRQIAVEQGVRSVRAS